MNYILSIIFFASGAATVFWNKSLSRKLGMFYAQRYKATFGNASHFLHLDDPNAFFSRFMCRGFVLTAGIILIIFAVAAFTGTNFVGPSVPVN